MMMYLDALAIFIEVAEKGSFIAAAKALGLPKTTVSRRISQLEDQLGIPLLYRTTRQVRLTEWGEKYFDLCSPALQTLKNAQNDLKIQEMKPKGRLRISASLVVGNDWLSTYLVAFHQKFPEIDLQVQLDNRYLDLIAEEIDIAFRVGPLPDSSFKARRMTRFKYVLCASSKYLKEKGYPIEPEDLVNHRCLLTSSTRQPIQWHFENQFKEQRVIALKGQFRCNHLALCQEFARRNLGITLLPDFMVTEDLQLGRLLPLLEDWTCRERDLFAVYPAQKHISPLVKLFVEELQLNFKNT